MLVDKVHDLGLWGMLHDVGKSKVPEETSNKKGALTEDEFQVINNHTKSGMEVIRGWDAMGKSRPNGRPAQREIRWWGISSESCR